MPKRSNIVSGTVRIPFKKHNINILHLIQGTTFQSSALLCIANWGKNRFDLCYIQYLVYNDNSENFLPSKMFLAVCSMYQRDIIQRYYVRNKQRMWKSSTYFFFSISLLSRGLGNFTLFYFSAFLREGAEGVKPQGGGRLRSTCAQPQTSRGTWTSPPASLQNGQGNSPALQIRMRIVY